MRQWVVGVAVFAVVTSSSCTLSEARGPVLSTAPQPVTCRQPVVRGDLVEASGRVRVTFTGENTCGDATVVTYQKDRWLKFNALGGAVLAAGTGLAIAFLSVGIYNSVSPIPTTPAELTTYRSLGELIGLSGFGVGVGLGVLTALIVRRDLPPHREIIETPGPGELRPFAVAGPLVSSRGARSWPLVDGQVELTALDASELESASVNGVLVTWSSAASERLESLGFCRRAIDGWTPGTVDCAREEPALRCAEGGWTLAADVLEELRRTCPERP